MTLYQRAQHYLHWGTQHYLHLKGHVNNKAYEMASDFKGPSAFPFPVFLKSQLLGVGTPDGRGQNCRFRRGQMSFIPFQSWDWTFENVLKLFHLVGGLVAMIFIFPLILGCSHHPNWRSLIFFRTGWVYNQQPVMFYHIVSWFELFKKPCYWI